MPSALACCFTSRNRCRHGDEPLNAYMSCILPAPTLRVLAPALIAAQPGAPEPGDAEVFGLVTWLWMHSPNHRHLPLHALGDQLLPAVLLRQFAVAIRQANGASQPVGYLAWANLNAQTESRYVSRPLYGLAPDEWTSGDRMWFWLHAKAINQSIKPGIDRARPPDPLTHPKRKSPPA
jgi:hemolysin-activating ACP:hemolysin acyltransferase